MEFNIDPKDLNLQDAAGMQLVEIIRNLADESGTTDYEDLENLPKINGVELKGNKTSDELHIAVSDEQVATAVDAWLADNVDPDTGYVLDSTLTMSNAAAPADKVGELKNDFNDNVTFDETLGYIPPLFLNDKFVNGMYANGVWRDDGNYGKSRTVHDYIPIGDYVITAKTATYTNLALTIHIYNSSKELLGLYRVGGPNGTPIQYSPVIQSGSYEIFESEALNTFENAAYITVSVGKVSGSTWYDLPSDLVLDLRDAHGEAQNILDVIGAVSDSIENNFTTVDLNDLPTYAWGKYIKPDGTLDNSGAHKVVSTKIKNVKQICIHPLKSPGVNLGTIENSNGDVVAYLPKPSYFDEETKYSLSLTKDTEYTLYLNFFSYAVTPNPYYTTIKLYYNNAIDYTKSQVVNIAKESTIELPRHSVRKPFDFNDKTAVFFGDSITVGVINADGTQTTEHNYPTEFSAKVGLTPTNKAVSGSRFYVGEGVSAAKILTQLQNTTLSDYDYIFIHGGYNDFASPESLSNMLSGISEIIDYLDNNFTGDVIWITPINMAKVITDRYNNVKDIKEYVLAMTKLIKESDSSWRYSVVQGWEFGFPTANSDSTFKSAMFGDGEVHPSELGYNVLFVPGLLTALC